MEVAVSELERSVTYHEREREKKLIDIDNLKERIHILENEILNHDICIEQLNAAKKLIVDNYLPDSPFIEVKVNE